MSLNLKHIIATFLMFTSLLFSGSVTAKETSVASAQNKVIEVTSGVLADLGKNKTTYSQNPATLDAMIRRDMLPFIDFDAMSKLTLGKHWRRASASQRTRFVNAYREMLIKSYGKLMLKYAGASVRSGNSVAGKKDGYVIVRTVVTPVGGSAIAANYDVRNNSGAWKAYNVQVGGVNLITNFRTNFTREVSTKGLDALITRLEKLKK